MTQTNCVDCAFGQLEPVVNLDKPSFVKLVQSRDDGKGVPVLYAREAGSVLLLDKYLRAQVVKQNL